MIDLGEWANDGYRIEGEPGSADRMSPEELDAAADRARELEERQRSAKTNGARRRRQMFRWKGYFWRSKFPASLSTGGR